MLRTRKTGSEEGVPQNWATGRPARFVVGVDGGGTGCRAALADHQGTILGVGISGPANITTDLAGSVGNILEAVGSAISAAEAKGALLPDVTELVAGIGLAGANVPELAAAVAAQLPFLKKRVETDGYVAVKGALHEGDGIVAAIGTGSIYSLQLNGVITQIGGWGLSVGDEAGGAWIGRGLLKLTLGAIDGFRPMTPLLQSTAAKRGGRAGIVGFSAQARPADFAGLAAEVVESADPAAVELMASADAQVIAAIRTLRSDESLATAFLGGLGGVFARRLHGQVAVIDPLGTHVDGALWLARQIQ